ncbi:MAG: GerMN domain-containing protein [Candidatus Margulisbacteria bacterium]|nr:GerMN domain-containing protein [Candidatus Margulisiibacteriota bacterium]
MFQEKFGLREEKVIAYFFKDEDLAMVKKDLLNEQSPLKESFNLLLAGPDEEMQAKGYYSVLPSSLHLFGYEIEERNLILKINRGFDSVSGGTSQTQAAIAQLVYTATAQKGIDKVVFEVEGQRGPLVIGGEGYIIDKPLSRKDIEL